MHAVSIHAPVGARTRAHAKLRDACIVSIHAPVGARTGERRTRSHVDAVSIHAPVGARTSAASVRHACLCCFNPRARGGANVDIRWRTMHRTVFQSTRPWGRERSQIAGGKSLAVVSIHAPVGARTKLHAERDISSMFQSTRPWGREPVRSHASAWYARFQSTRPWGRERSRGTHAAAVSTWFQSTRPWGRELTMTGYALCSADVSIHAPVGARTSQYCSVALVRMFQSTRPWGANLAASTA